jgi:hypothetical protein
MRTLRGLLRDESGMTMALAIMMILIMSVMGAGLLTFVTRDLNTVLEVNRGQRAFEAADAGVGAAGRQLAANVVREHYYGDPVDDIQWAASQGGLTLNDLDGKDPDGAGPLEDPTPDSVNVTIQYKAATADFPEHFEVISEGAYGNAVRKIEAIFKGVEVDAGGGESIGHPLYYTPSDIRIEAQVQLNGISMFSEQDILIQGVTDPLSFVHEYESPGNTLSIPNSDDELCNWKSDVPLPHCFEDATGGWNTVGRTWDKKNGTREDFQEPGFAAEGKICGFPTAATAMGECGATLSAADGVYGYDSTTGNKTMSRTAEGYTNLWGNNLTFVDKQNLEPNEAGTITYPFLRPTPIPEGFKKEACLPSASPCAPSASNDYFVGSPSATDWGNLLSSDPNRIAFVDAQNQNITFNPGGTTKGILVVWCGHLTQATKFQGIILNLHGDGSAFSSTNCAGNDELGTYTNNGQDCQCWMYADGGTATTAGITLRNGSKIFFYSGDWSFLSDLFESPPPTSFAPQGWRELYE